MQLFKRLFQLIKNLFNKKDTSNLDMSTLDDEQSQFTTDKTSDDSILKNKVSLDEDFAFVEKNNIIDSINLLRTKLSRIELVCKDEYLKFNNKLDYLENLCKNEYDVYSHTVREGKLAFTCDPKFNSDIKKGIIDVQIEIEDFIDKVGKYKILQERIEKMTNELLIYYEEYKKGSFKGDFLQLINEAKLTLENVLNRVIGNEIVHSSLASDFLDKKSLNDAYMYLLYLIEKCTIYYQVKNNCFNILDIKKSFKECFLIFLMKDLESIKNNIKTLEGTKYYPGLMGKFEKIKSINISNIDEVLRGDNFFKDFVDIEDAIVLINKKIASESIRQKTKNLLNILQS